MNIGIFIRILLCIAALGGFLFAYIEKQNQITHLRLKIPALAQELQVIQQENTRLKFEIDQFESPQNLMELSRRPEFSHLKYPEPDKILTIQVPESAL